MSNANEENNELDDLFTKADDSDGSDFFASLNDSQDAASDDPFAGFSGAASDAESASSSFSTSIETDDAFGVFGASEADGADPFGGQAVAASVDAPATPAADKKGKKGKAPKAKKEKAPKAPKVKKEKAPKSDVMHGSPKPFVVLGAIFLLGILVANAVAFMTAGSASIMFLACFDVLGLILLAVPALLIKQLRTRAVGLFDVFLALVAAFLTIAAMTFLAQQAKNYGASSKVASNVAVSSFDVRA